MKQTAVVTAVSGDLAELTHGCENTCASCHCTGRRIFKAECGDLNVRPGDSVEVSASSLTMLGSAVLILMVPFAAAAAVWFLTRRTGMPEGTSVTFSALTAAAAFGGLMCSRRSRRFPKVTKIISK